MQEQKRTYDDDLGLDLQADPVPLPSSVPLAPLGRRLVAGVLDLFCLAVAFSVVNAEQPVGGEWAIAANIAVGLLLYVVLQGTVHLARPGRTAGMLVARIKLVGVDGAAPSFVRGFVARSALLAVASVAQRLFPLSVGDVDGRPFYDHACGTWLVRA